MAASTLVQNMHAEFLRDVNAAIDRMTLGAHDAPPAPKRRPRYRRIAVAYDGSEGADLALAWAKEIAGLHGSEVLIASGYAPPDIAGGSLGYGWYPNYARLYEDAQAWARGLSDSTASILREADLNASSYAFEGSAWRGLSELAQERHVDLILTGAARRGALGRLFLGSTAMGLIEHAPCSVLVARGAPPVTRVLVGTDGSQVSYRAVAHALGIASEMNAELVVEHVVEYPEEAAEKHPEGFLKSVVSKIDLPAPPPRVRYAIDVGRPAARILERAQEGSAGLIVVGSHGRGVVERALLGSVSRRVVNDARASVLVVKGTRG